MSFFISKDGKPLQFKNQDNENFDSIKPSQVKNKAKDLRFKLSKLIINRIDFITVTINNNLFVHKFM